MANYVFNIAKGRVVELANRVDINDPSSSAFILIPLKTSETEANAQDFDTVEAFLAGAADEQTEGWSRKTLTDVDFSAITPDDTNNRGVVSLPEVKWTTPTSGKNTTGLLIAYDANSGSGTDADLVPLLHLDFAVTADGNDVVINAGEVFRAT